jgi:hypothetical protein
MQKTHLVFVLINIRTEDGSIPSVAGACVGSIPILRQGCQIGANPIINTLWPYGAREAQLAFNQQIVRALLRRATNLPMCLSGRQD